MIYGLFWGFSPTSGVGTDQVAVLAVVLGVFPASIPLIFVPCIFSFP